MKITKILVIISMLVCLFNFVEIRESNAEIVVLKLGKYDKDEKRDHLRKIINGSYEADNLVHRSKNYILDYLGEPDSVDKYLSENYSSESWCYLFKEEGKIFSSSSIVINFDKWGSITSISVFK